MVGSEFVKNGFWSLWILSDDNNCFGFRVEARSASVGSDADARRWIRGEEMIAVGERRPRSASLCAEAIIAGHGWTVSGQQRRYGARGGEAGEASCAIARKVSPLRLSRTSRVPNLAAGGIKGCEDREERTDVSSSRLFANFGNIRSFSPAACPLFHLAGKRDEPTAACRRIPNGASRREVASGARKKKAPRTYPKMRERILHHVCR